MKSPRPPRILLVFPSAYYVPRTLTRDEIKASQFALASYLARFFPVQYADFENSIGRPDTAIQIRRFERKVREHLEQQDFDILAISCWTSLSYKAAMATARIARDLYSDRLIVVGGYHPTARPDDFMTADNLIDYVVRGEGEVAFRDIAEAFRADGRPSETTVVIGSSLYPSDFAAPDWELVDDMIRSEFAEGVGTLCIYLSRGCPFACSFCMETLKDNCWRALPTETAIEQIRVIAERYPVQAIALGDACFGVSRQWRKDFLRRLVNLKPSNWILFETRPEYLDEEDIRMLAELKVEIQIGLESASPQMLKLMNKTRQPERFLAKFLEVSHLLSEHDIVHGANLVFNHPGETHQTLEETYAFVDSELALGKSSLMWSCHGYMHFPGSAVDLNRGYYEERFGTVFQSPDWWRLDENPYVSSRRVIPSHDLGGEGVGLWSEMFRQRTPQFIANLSDKAFRLAAESYYPEWQNNPRYQMLLQR